eukprot:2135400-Prymnesium_polylepis.1
MEFRCVQAGVYTAVEFRGISLTNSTGRRSAPHPGNSAHASQADVCVCVEWGGCVVCMCVGV